MCGDGKEAFRFICFDESCYECNFFKNGKCQVNERYGRPVPIPGYGRE